MFENSLLLFARAQNGGAGFLLLVLYTILWWPSHIFFRWLRGKTGRVSGSILSVLICTAASLGLGYLGYWLGEHTTNLELKSLGSSDGHGGFKDENFMYLPFCFASVGVWLGFLSGYLRIPITEEDIEKRK